MLTRTSASDSALAGSVALPIVALDVPDGDSAIALVDRLEGADFFKVGLQLFTAAGPGLVERLKNRGLRVFLDLKFHDIPNTVASAVSSAAELGVDLLTIHASGGTAMLDAAADAAASAATPPLLLGVTVLTSLTDDDLARSWGRDTIDIDHEVERLAGIAAAAGLDGVVAAVSELETIRRSAPSLKVLTPGIRLATSASNDQARIATPEQAVRLGSDFLVIGRTVTAASDPAEAFREVRRSMARGAES